MGGAGREGWAHRQSWREWAGEGGQQGSPEEGHRDPLLSEGRAKAGLSTATEGGGEVRRVLLQCFPR